MMYENILIEYVEVCKKDPEEFMLQVGKFSSIRKILTHTYMELVAQGKCVQIENLGQEEKRELWEQAKLVSSIQERNYVIEVVKALHGFGTYVSLKYPNAL